MIDCDVARKSGATISGNSDESFGRYETLMDESAVDRETKRVENVKMGRQVTAKERDLTATTKDLKATQDVRLCFRFIILSSNMISYLLCL